MAKHDDRSGNLVCSFCGKSQDEVRKLIAGPTVYICDECIDLCNDIIAEETDSEEAFSQSSAEKVDVDLVIGTCRDGDAQRICLTGGKSVGRIDLVRGLLPAAHPGVHLGQSQVNLAVASNCQCMDNMLI